MHELTCAKCGNSTHSDVGPLRVVVWFTMLLGGTSIVFAARLLHVLGG